MFMCRVFSCVFGRGCLLWPVRSLGKTLLAFALLHSAFQGQICLLPHRPWPLAWGCSSRLPPPTLGVGWLLLAMLLCSPSHPVNLITRITALSNSMKLSHAVWGHPRRVGHGGEVWQNVVHWRREWQTTSVFLPWEPHEQYEKAKWSSERGTPQVGKPTMLLEISGEITPERMKGWSQSKKLCLISPQNDMRSSVSSLCVLL